MAKQMPYDDAFGNHYDTSYWRLVQLTINIADAVATVTFYGYKDKASREANRRSIGSKSYTLSDDSFNAMMAEHLKAGGPNIMQLAYKIATDSKDVVTDPEDPSKNKSFFDGARDLV